MSRTKKNSSAEKYERQKALARERKRRSLANRTEEQIEAKKKYDRERQARLREEKKVKSVADMTPREHRLKKKYWKERNKIRSIKKKNANKTVEAETAPCYPGPSGVERPTAEDSIQKKRGRKQIRKDRSKAYRKIEKQRKRIKELEKSLNKYKQRLHREKSKLKANVSPSPRKLVSQTVGKEKVSPHVRKQLFLGFSLQKQVQHQVKKNAGSKKDNQQMRKVIGNEKLKQYRVQKYFRKILPYSTNKILQTNSNPSDYTRKKKTTIRQQLSEKTRLFYEDDRISRMCPGKKDYIKKGPIKKQRRVLLQPLAKLHKQFEEEQNCKISLSTFKRSRPFWVTFPKRSDRETCACIKHTNMQLMVRALRQTNVIVQQTPSEVISATVCSPDNEQCMMSTCDKCKHNEIPFFYEEDFTMKYSKWKQDRVEKVIKNKKKIIKMTVKSKEMKEVSKVKKEFKKQLEIYKKHVYYTNYLATKVKEKTESVKSDELVFRLDFSENYVCKYAQEIQSVHFGASKKQLCLNTGVRYALVDGSVETECFASVSDNLDHQAHAIWAHMAPILERSSQRFPDTTTVHFISDSPSSQYRNRMNMHLFKNFVPKYFPKLQNMTWNYTEAGHGKGAMDGVGGTLKREADRKVSYGQDITCASEFVAALKDFKITLFEVPAKDVEEIKNEIANLKVQAIKGIMNVHQVVYSSGVMYGRKLICFECDPSKKCEHFHLFEIFPKEKEISTTEEMNAGPVTNRKKNKISVDDVYTSSEDDDSFSSVVENMPLASRKQDLMSDYGGGGECTTSSKQELESGAFVIVKLKEEGKKRKWQQFIAICQNNVINNEIEVMFMKCSSKDNSLYTVDENDVSLVQLDQIVAILPAPVINLKGNRVFYKFKKLN